MFNKKYIVQWEYSIIKMWWTEFEFNSKKKAFKIAGRMLARKNNIANWRIVEYDKRDNTFHIIFQSDISRREISEYNLKSFTLEDLHRNNFYRSK